MKKEFYEALSAPFNGHPRRLSALRWINRITTGLIYVLYICIIVVLIVNHNWWDLLLSTVIPATGLVGVSIWRRVANVPRRYEVWNTPCLLGKTSPGESFPSRHVFSAAVIAVTAFRLWWPLGTVAALATVVLAVVRVVGGAHYVRDVAVGGTVGGLWGIVWFLLIGLLTA